MANQKLPLSSRPGFVLLVEVFYLLVLFVIGLIYLTDLHKLLPFTLPDKFGPIAVGVPWFGALGAVIISLSGIVYHRNDWDPGWKFWHFTRPLIGASLAIIAVLIFQAGILAVASSPTAANGVTAPQNLLYYLIAFVVGYREETFRDLIKKLGDVILTPGGGTPPPVSSALPTVTSINPTSGPTSGGTSVTITGTGFTGATGVAFGSTAASNISVKSDTQVTTTSPAANRSGAVDVTVTTPNGTSGTSSADQFTYLTSTPLPTVTSITPTSGPTGGGTSVTITGTGFTGVTAVNFASIAARSFNFDSDTQITAVSPTAVSSGAVDVTVVTPGGTSTTGTADQFTYT